MSHSPRIGSSVTQIALLLLLGWLSSACSTTMVPLTYENAAAAAWKPAPAALQVGHFTDDRKNESNWLGAIRGGYGNPLKKLRTEKPMSAVVEDAFREAIVAREALAPPTAQAAFEIKGSTLPPHRAMAT